MQDQSSTQPQSPSPRTPRSIPLGAIAVFSAAVLAVGGGLTWFTWYALHSSVSSSPPSTVKPLEPATPPEPSRSDISQAPIEQTIEIYWLKSVGNKIELTATPTKIEAAGQPAAILNAAFEHLLQGTSEPHLASTIPPGTKLQQLEVKADGVHIDLSPEFASGGGSTSMTGRVAQVIYTATALDPNAPVWISVNGKPLEVLGGEGLLIDQPMTRESFKQNFTL